MLIKKYQWFHTLFLSCFKKHVKYINIIYYTALLLWFNVYGFGVFSHVFELCLVIAKHLMNKLWYVI